ncbi:MAG: MFS transporter [Thermodesulfobacteriota bacterium]
MAWPVRYKVIGLLMLSTIINYVDRVNISVAAPDIMRQTGWDKAQFGLVLSAFLCGYALFQFPGGVIADRWSARKVLGLSCLGFSLFTALTPLGQSGFLAMLVLRFLVGACESISLPALASFNARWVPRQEFGRAQMVSISGTSIGQMLAYPTTTVIIEAFAWPMVFYFNAAVGFLWMAVWFLYTTDTPREHPAIDPAELRHIEDQRMPAAQHALPFRSIATAPSVLFLCLTYMLYAFIAWIFILWFPTYLVEARGFSRMEMGVVGMLPTFGSFLGMLCGGVVSDWLLRRGYSARVARARGVCRPGDAVAPWRGAGALGRAVGGLLRPVLFHFLPRGGGLLDHAARTGAASGRGSWRRHEHLRQLRRHLRPDGRRTHYCPDRQLGDAFLCGGGLRPRQQRDFYVPGAHRADYGGRGLAGRGRGEGRSRHRVGALSEGRGSWISPPGG